MATPSMGVAGFSCPNPFAYAGIDEVLALTLFALLRTRTPITRHCSISYVLGSRSFHGTLPRTGRDPFRIITPGESPCPTPQPAPWTVARCG